MSRLFNVFVLACLFMFGIPLMLYMMGHVLMLMGRLM